MSWRIVPAKEKFSDNKSEWDKLNTELYDSHPYFQSVFYEPLLEKFGTGDEKLCIHYNAREEIDGMLILVHSGYGAVSLFKPAQAQISPVLVKNAELLYELLKKLPYTFQLDLLSQDPLYLPLFTEYQEKRLFRQNYNYTMAVNLVGTFNEYWKSRAGKLRNNLKRYFKRASENFENIEYRLCKSKDEIDSAFERYAKLESSGWKGKAGTAIGLGNKQGEFYLDVMRQFARANSAAIHELYFDDYLVASRISVCNRNMMVMLKTSYNEEFSKYAPGRLLLYRVLEHQFEYKEVSTIEFYTNASKDQLAWSTDNRYIDHLTLFRNSYIYRMYSWIKLCRSFISKKS